MEARGLVFYELNEVPRVILERFADKHPDSNIASMLDSAILYETKAIDPQPLSPWTTWPTLHRGVPVSKHGITELGQDVTSVNEAYPPVWTLLAQSGVRVGVFGCLHSFPVPDDADNVMFYVPDTFAESPNALPNKLSSFQELNLHLVKRSGRNVSGGFPLGLGLKFLRDAIGNGLTARTFFRVVQQLMSERLRKESLVRRRSIQTEIAFDLLLRQLQTQTPRASFFFTNHLASSMHRYWPAAFPEDYPDSDFSGSWVASWKGEVEFSLRVADYQIGRLREECIRSNLGFCLASSMGQAPVRGAEPIKSQVMITDIGKFLDALGIGRDQWTPQMSMAPRQVVRPTHPDFSSKVRNIENLKVNGEGIPYVITATGEYCFELSQIDAGSVVVTANDVVRKGSDFGIENVILQDGTGSYAYHVPEGVLILDDLCSADDSETSVGWRQISVLDVAPAVLDAFNVPIPSYMKKNAINL